MRLQSAKQTHMSTAVKFKTQHFTQNICLCVSKINTAINKGLPQKPLTYRSL